jgi:hypothetical protein
MQEVVPMVRMMSIFFTSFIAVFFGITFIYVQTLPQKHKAPSNDQKPHLASSASVQEKKVN